MWNVRRIIEKHLEDMCHVIGMLGYIWNVRTEEHLQDICHVIGMLGKEPLHPECQQEEN